MQLAKVYLAIHRLEFSSLCSNSFDGSHAFTTFTGSGWFTHLSQTDDHVMRPSVKSCRTKVQEKFVSGHFNCLQGNNSHHWINCNFKSSHKGRWSEMSNNDWSRHSCLRSARITVTLYTSGWAQHAVAVRDLTISHRRLTCTSQSKQVCFKNVTWLVDRSHFG